MKEKRYYYDGKINLNETIILQDEEFHHLSNVMRSKTGERVCLFNGDGYFYFGTIIEISKKFAKIKVEESTLSNNEPAKQIDVVQALAKGDKLSLIMQKITELGASNFILFESKFCDVKSNTHKHERMKQVSISASKQCGRATIVSCNQSIMSVSDISNIVKDYDAFFIAYENETGLTLTDYLLDSNKEFKKVAIMIGAEGGFSEKEIELLKSSGAIIVSLGKRILRTETASIACTAILSQILKN